VNNVGAYTPSPPLKDANFRRRKNWTHFHIVLPNSFGLSWGK